jgi:hypothetical protein
MPQAPPVANPYGSYVSAPQPPQPAYQDVAASHPDAASYGGGYTNGQQADGSWYGGAANGYLPSPGYAEGDPAVSGYTGGDPAVSGYTGGDPAVSGYPANGYNGAVAAGHGYGAVDYQDVSYQDVSYQGAGYQAAPPAPNGYGPQGHFAGQFDQRGYSASDPAYGQDGYQGYPGYGASGR